MITAIIFTIYKSPKAENIFLQEKKCDLKRWQGPKLSLWWVSGDGVGGGPCCWWEAITGTSDKETRRSFNRDQNVALFREFPARADNSLHLRNTGGLTQAQGLAYFSNHPALFSSV